MMITTMMTVRFLTAGTVLLLFAFQTVDGFVVPRSIRPPPSVTKQTLLLPGAVTSLQLSPVDISLSLSESLTSTVTQEQAEALAGPLFGASLFPYLAFLYWLDVEENETPKGITVGFATCLLFVFLTIPAAIAAKLLYGVSLADSDWLHGSAESLLTMTNLVTVVAFRQALQYEEAVVAMPEASTMESPASATSYQPMILLVVLLTTFAGITAAVPALQGATVHTPYLNGFMDLDPSSMPSEPDNALTVATWIIHISSLVEFLVAMGFCWRWADLTKNPKWKGLTWGLLPLHSSGITACTYHLFYNRIPLLVPLQAFLTCLGNTTAAFATLRIALSNGWEPPEWLKTYSEQILAASFMEDDSSQQEEESSSSLVGFEDLGDALSGDNDYSFLVKLFVGCAVASYVVKYGEAGVLEIPDHPSTLLGVTVILVPSMLNAFKWWKRSQDATFAGWF